MRKNVKKAVLAAAAGAFLAAAVPATCYAAFSYGAWNGYFSQWFDSLDRSAPFCTAAASAIRSDWIDYSDTEPAKQQNVYQPAPLVKKDDDVADLVHLVSGQEKTEDVDLSALATADERRQALAAALEDAGVGKLVLIQDDTVISDEREDRDAEQEEQTEEQESASVQASADRGTGAIAASSVLRTAKIGGKTSAGTKLSAPAAGKVSSVSGIKTAAVPAMRPLALAGTVAPYPGYYTTGPSGTSTSLSGPGSMTNSSTLRVEDSSKNAGPTVKEISLSETEHADYGVYSESISGYYYFYSTTGNNSITDKPVSIDFPSNITYTLEKDGVPMAYTSKQTLSETGTYIFHIEAIKDAMKPASEQTLFKTTYNFRIQPKIAKPAEAKSSSSASSGSQGSTDRYSTDAYAQTQPQSPNSYSAYQAANAAASAYSTPTDISVEEAMKVLEASGIKVQDQSETSAAAETAPAEDPAKEGKVIFDAGSGMYSVSYGNGRTLIASVTNGMMTNGSVTVNREKLGSFDSIALLKDGQSLTFPESGTFAEAGDYSIILKDSGKTFTYSFRIVKDGIEKGTVWTVPEGTVVTGITLNGKAEDLSGQSEIYDGSRVSFVKAGSYEITATDISGRVYGVTAKVGTEPPTVSTQETDKGVKVIYDPELTDHIELVRGKSVKTMESIDEITTPGSYEVRVYGKDGTMVSASFKVKRKVNPASVAVVGIIILLIGVAAFAVRAVRDRESVK